MNTKYKLTIHTKQGLPGKLSYLNFLPQPTTSKWVKNTPVYLCNLRPSIYKSWCLNTHFIPSDWLKLRIKQNKNDYGCAQHSKGFLLEFIYFKFELLPKWNQVNENNPIL